MVGMPTMNANSVAASRDDRPASIAAKIVAAEREVPGNTAASTCASPTQIAIFQVTTSLGVMPAAARSISRIAIPPMIRAHATRSEEHTSELQSLMRISYAVFCLTKKKIHNKQHNRTQELTN